MEKPKLADAVVIIERNGKFAFIHPDIPTWTVFQRAGARILNLCDGTRDMREIADVVAHEFGDPVNEVEKAVLRIVDKCEKAGFFRNVTPAETIEESPIMDLLYLSVTRECNLRCTYCYASAGKPMNDELSLGQIKSLLDQFKALGKGAEQTIIISGGEPLLRKDFWEIVEYAKGLGFPLVLSTNGILIDKETARKIRKYFGGVQISLDGDRELHEKYRGKGSYDGAIRGIENLIEANFMPSISATITKENFRKIDKLWEVCEKYGIKHVKTTPLVPFGRAENKDEMVLTKEEYIELTDRTSKFLIQQGLQVILDDEISIFSGGTSLRGTGHSCSACYTSLSIEPNGDVFPCQAASAGEFSCGNIKEQPLEEIWRSSRVGRDWLSRSINRIPECKACVWKMYCGGGCYIQAIIAHGTVHAPDLYCEVYKYQYENSFWDFIEKSSNKKERGVGEND